MREIWMRENPLEIYRQNLRISMEYLLHSTVKYILHGTGYAASGVAAVEGPVQ